MWRPRRCSTGSRDPHPERDRAFCTDKDVHFCPGTVGGAEWNGPAYDPQTNLILIGEVDWCATVRMQDAAQIQEVGLGKAWSGMATIDPYRTYGTPDPFGSWAGWVYAVDADTGAWKWRVRSNYPIQSGMTPTAGGIVFFGDMGGTSTHWMPPAADGSGVRRLAARSAAASSRISRTVRKELRSRAALLRFFGQQKS